MTTLIDIFLLPLYKIKNEYINNNQLIPKEEIDIYLLYPSIISNNLDIISKKIL